MTTSIIKCRVDAFTNERFPNRNSGGWATLKLDATTDERKHAFLHFTVPDAVMRGANLTEALLRFTPKVDAGSTTGEVRRLTGGWKEGQITFSDAPSTTATNATGFTETWAGEIEVDVTDLISDAISAGEFLGFRITTTATAERRFHSSEAAADVRPTLELAWSTAPLSPDDLKPSGGRAASSASPRLSWSFRGRFGGQTQSGYEVEVRNASTLVSVEDTGEVVSSDAFHDMTEVLVEGTAYDWRVRAQDGDGLWSPFSEWVEFTFVGIGTVTITNPSLGIVNDTTPPFTWTYSGTQEEAEVTVFAKDTAGVYRNRHQLTRRVYSPTSYTPPQGVIKSQETDFYKVRVRVWPDADLEDISGAPSYAQDEQVFSFVLTEDVTAPADLTATPDLVAPKVALAWTRADAPDSFLVIVDDEVVAELDPTETFVSGTSYAQDYWGAVPGTEHTYEVAAVVNNEVSAANPTDAATIEVVGIWLVNPEAGTFVRIRGREQPSEVIGESGETLYPIGRNEPVRVRDSLRGREGTVSGHVSNESFLTAKAAEALLNEMNGIMGPFRYIGPPNRNFPVHIHSLSTPPDAELDGRYVASFAYEQVAEFTPLAGVVGSGGFSGGY